jgi:hypothetical protein
MPGYFLRVAIALDQFVQAVSNKGIYGETISARAGKAMIRYQRGQSVRRWGCVLCGWLDRLQSGHCRKAIDHDRERAQAVLDDLAGY